MVITCEKCSIRFNLDESLLNKEGSKVRCSQCKHVFIAYPLAPSIPSLDLGDDSKEAMEPDDLQLDQDLGLDETEELEEFRLDDDFDDALEPGELDLGEKPTATEPDLELDLEEAQEPDGLDFEFDLGDDLELDLGETPTDTEPGLELDLKEAQEPDELDLEFDLGDDLELDLEETPTDTEPDLELDLEEAQEPDELDLEFDLGDDLELDLEEAPTDTEPDLELDLGDDFEPIDDAGLADPEQDEDLELYEELEFELEDDELDLSTLETPGADKTAADDSEFNLELDVDLDLNLDLDPQEPDVIEPMAETAEPDEELDLAEFDEMLEEQEAFQGQEELPEPETDRPRATDVPEPDTEETVELEAPGEKQDTAPLTEEQAPTEKVEIETPPPLDYGIDEDFKKPIKIGKPVLVILLLAIMALGGYSACIMYGIEIPYLSTIKVPFLSDYLAPPPPPAPPIRLAPEKKSVTGRFVTNTSAGTLFVITGRVVNTSEALCSHIKIKGTLITKEKVKAREKTVYCGNLIPEDQLKTLEMTTMDTQFAKITGNNQSNINIEPGRAVPFMIVFSDLPDNLENFTVNVAGFERKNQEN
ncbi:MAG: zinc-ribbon domain-containing protein [Desulfobacterium sp.]|nr:zinc-ribbon domain-containing protein [Desulfobacterium sp.]